MQWRGIGIFGATYFERHEFVVWLWSPGIDLDRVLQRYHQELDSFVFHYFEVNSTL